MARPWESALHFELTINYLTLRPIYPKDFAPGGRVVSHFDAATTLAFQLYTTPVAVAAPVLQLYPALVAVIAPVLQLWFAQVVAAAPVLQLRFSPVLVAMLWLQNLLCLPLS